MKFKALCWRVPVINYVSAALPWHLRCFTGLIRITRQRLIGPIKGRHENHQEAHRGGIVYLIHSCLSETAGREGHGQGIAPGAQQRVSVVQVD